MDEDWDNLVILDACRCDMFKELNGFEGDLDYRISQGAVSGEFLLENFDGSTFNDTVYMTANPWVSHFAGDRYEFHTIVPAWEDRWDEKKKTVPPSEMVAATLRAHEEFPDKRLIAHFMQPHQPFLGDSARSKIGVMSGNVAAKRIAEGKSKPGNIDRSEIPHVYSLFENGDLARDEVVEMYRENLLVTLPHVEDLLDELLGKSVVTADHGEMFGDKPFIFAKPVYGHSATYHTEDLVKVPWFTVDSGERKTIKEEASMTSDHSAESEGIRDRLVDLGYLE